MIQPKNNNNNVLTISVYRVVAGVAKKRCFVDASIFSIDHKRNILMHMCVFEGGRILEVVEAKVTM